jgi:hypothetical protein
MTIFANLFMVVTMMFSYQPVMFVMAFVIVMPGAMFRMMVIVIISISTMVVLIQPEVAVSMMVVFVCFVMFMPAIVVNPVFSAIRPGNTCKQKN